MRRRNRLRRLSDGRDRRLVALIVAYGLFGFGYVITATFISAIVRSEPDLKSLEPVIWLIVGVGAIPSVALWSWIGRRIGNGRAYAMACLVEAGAVTLSVIAGLAGGGRPFGPAAGRHLRRHHRHRPGAMPASSRGSIPGAISP